jgi:hypothetical protein
MAVTYVDSFLKIVIIDKPANFDFLLGLVNKWFLYLRISLHKI